MSLLCSIDGQITPVEEATVSVTDEGLVRGDGAFELLKLYDGRAFALKDHLDRLGVTCNGVFLDWDRALFEREIDALLEQNERPDAYLRLILTRPGRRIALLEAPMSFEHDMALSSVRYRPTIVLTGLKTLSYSANMTATRIAQQAGAKEALLVEPDGTILEAPTSSIFWVTADGTIRTPELESGILASITRDRVLQVVPVEEGRYKLEDVFEAAEVFLASTIREIQGVKELDGLSYESPGPVTQRVAGLLSERIQAELNGAA